MGWDGNWRFWIFCCHTSMWIRVNIVMPWNYSVFKQQLNPCVTQCDYVMIRHNYYLNNQICVTTPHEQMLARSIGCFTIILYSKSYLCNRPWKPTGWWDVEVPTFSLDNRHIDGGEVISLTRRPPFTPRRIPDTRFS
jgi:hypothetical protein